MENNQLALIQALEQRVIALELALKKNSFSDTDIYIKRSFFKTELNVPNLSADPGNGKYGDVIIIGGKLMVCASLTSGTFVVVGTQS